MLNSDSTLLSVAVSTKRPLGANFTLELFGMRHHDHVGRMGEHEDERSVEGTGQPDQVKLNAISGWFGASRRAQAGCQAKATHMGGCEFPERCAAKVRKHRPVAASQRRLGWTWGVGHNDGHKP